MMNFLTIVLAIITANIIMGAVGFALCMSPKFTGWIYQMYLKMFERQLKIFEKEFEELD